MTESADNSETGQKKWYLVHSNPTALIEGERIHTCVEGRYITIYRYKSRLYAMDSTCYHAGGPIGDGVIRDIEELGESVVVCPWHRFEVCLSDGVRAYEAIDMSSGKPVATGWKKGKIVQRVHDIYEDTAGIFVVSLPFSIHQYPEHYLLIDLTVTQSLREPLLK